MGSPAQYLGIGAYIATGAGLEVKVGYKPDFIQFINLTTGALAEYLSNMDAGTVVTHDSGTDAVDTAQGVTLTDLGFTIGTNAVINTSTNQVHWVAWGN